MKHKLQHNFPSWLSVLLVLMTSPLVAQNDGAMIEEITGLSGQRDQASGVFKVTAKGFGGLAIPEANTISAAPLEAILDMEGTSKDGMFKVSVGRDVEMECGCKVGGAMGIASWAAFGGADEAASVDGDFAVLESNLQSVLKSLRANEINIVAIHNHMIQESPRIIFLHYWGKGKAVDLAKAVKAALAIAHPKSE